MRRNTSQRSALIQDVNEYGLNIDTREIWLSIDKDSTEEMIDWRSANRFLKNLSILESTNHNTILIHQCTCGGEWNYGMAIYDGIKAARSPVVLLAHAHARSMSSIIPQAADLRVIMPNADFLIHFGTCAADADCQSFIAEADWVKTLNERMLDIYAKRLAQSPHWRKRRWGKERIKRDFLIPELNTRRECYWSAQDAVQFGFMDVVFGSRGCESIAKLRAWKKQKPPKATGQQ